MTGIQTLWRVLTEHQQSVDDLGGRVISCYWWDRTWTNIEKCTWIRTQKMRFIMWPKYFKNLIPNGKNRMIKVNMWKRVAEPWKSVEIQVTCNVGGMYQLQVLLLTCILFAWQIILYTTGQRRQGCPPHLNIAMNSICTGVYPLLKD